jgi:hypothetical protein
MCLLTLFLLYSLGGDVWIQIQKVGIQNQGTSTWNILFFVHN